MDTKQMSREEKYEYWTMVVEEFESSEKSIREQCRANSIAYAQYYDWRKKIKQRHSPESNTFVEVAKPDRCASVSSNVVCLEYNDCKIYLPDNFETSVLSRVLSVLRNS